MRWLTERIRHVWPTPYGDPPEFYSASRTDQRRLLAAHLRELDPEHCQDLILNAPRSAELLQKLVISVLEDDHDPWPLYSLIETEAEKVYRNEIDEQIAVDWSMRQWGRVS